MAVLKKLQLLVAIGGQGLQEFNENGGDDAESLNKAIRYIEAVSGAEFQVALDYLDADLPLYGE